MLCVWGIRPQLQRTAYLLSASIAFYFIGSHWDVYILQPSPLHSCLTCYYSLFSSPTATLPFSISNKPPDSLSSLTQLNPQSQVTQPNVCVVRCLLVLYRFY